MKFAGNGLISSAYDVLATTAGTYAALTKIVASRPGPQAPIGAIGTGATVGCMLEVSIIVLFGENPADLPPLLATYPCITFFISPTSPM